MPDVRLVPSLSVTAAEAVEVLLRLEPRLAVDLNARTFAYTASLVGAAPVGVHGATTLYGVVDIALVRLVLRLEAETSRPVARAVMAGMWPDVRALLEPSRPRAVALVVPVASRPPWLRQPPVLMAETETRKQEIAGVVVPLRSVAAGVLETVRAIRGRRSTVPFFGREVAPSTAATWIRELRQPGQRYVSLSGK